MEIKINGKLEMTNADKKAIENVLVAIENLPSHIDMKILLNDKETDVKVKVCTEEILNEILSSSTTAVKDDSLFAKKDLSIRTIIFEHKSDFYKIVPTREVFIKMDGYEDELSIFFDIYINGELEKSTSAVVENDDNKLMNAMNKIIEGIINQ